MRRVGRERTMWWVAIAALAMALFVRPAHAKQYLIKEGDDWATKCKNAGAGDEIILLPGRHRAASFESLMGTADKPIVIRAANPATPPVICQQNQREGIRIKEAAYVTIKNIEIVGATVAGISIYGAPLGAAGKNSHADPDEKPAFGNVTIKGVSISKIGPAPAKQRHGIILSGLTGVKVEDCKIEGWAGSAVEMIACHEVTVTRCLFRGVKEHLQQNGIRTRAGTDEVRIENSRFEDAGDIVLCFGYLGGNSKPEDFANGIPANAAAGTLFEAARVRAENCVIVGGQTAVAYINADDCVVRNLTIINPLKSVIQFATEQTDPKFTRGKRNVFGLNIVTWKPGSLRQLVEMAAVPPEFLLEENVWWSGETPDKEKLRRLGSLPGDFSPQTLAEITERLKKQGQFSTTALEQLKKVGPQIDQCARRQLIDADPQLSEENLPKNAVLRNFGIAPSQSLIGTASFAPRSDS